MKHLGGTPERGTIIELTEAERLTLASLQNAVDGKGWDWDAILDRRHIQERNMDNVFLAIREFILGKFAVNDLRKAIDDLDKTLGILEDRKE